MNPLQLIRPFLRRLRLLTPTVDSFYLLGRRLVLTPPPAPPTGYRLALVTHPTDPHFNDLVAFSATQGMNADWCQQELRDGVFMVLAISTQSARVAGSAWAATRTHTVDPIFHNFDPGPLGSFMLNAFVSPEHRGSKLQRHMLHPRFLRLHALGRHFAYAIVNCTNAPSLRNYRNDQFLTVMRIDIIRIAGQTLANFRRLTHTLPTGKFKAKSWPHSPYLHFVNENQPLNPPT